MRVQVVSRIVSASFCQILAELVSFDSLARSVSHLSSSVRIYFEQMRSDLKNYGIRQVILSLSTAY